MKACKDCQHSTDKRICTHPDVTETLTDYYEGKTYVTAISCAAARQLGKCGPEAKFWEPREVGFGQRADPPITKIQLG